MAITKRNIIITTTIFILAITGVSIMKKDQPISQNKESRTVEVTEHVDEKSGQKYTKHTPVIVQEPTYQEVSKTTEEEVVEDVLVEQPPFDPKTYAENKLRNSLPAENNEAYMKWQLPCLNELINKTINGEPTKEDIDTLFSKTAKYTSVCSALQVFRASGNY